MRLMGITVMVLASAFAAMGGAVPSAWATSPAYDCKAAAGLVEELICARDDFSLLDQEVDHLYHLVLRDPSLPHEALVTLKATQRGWIEGRNACWKSGAGVSDCISASYVMRIHDLRAEFPGSMKGETRSTGPVLFDCGGPGEPVSAVFVRDPGHVSLRWDDGFLVLPQVPAASGARYESADGDAFWVKGTEAQARLDGYGLTCAELPAG